MQTLQEVQRNIKMLGFSPNRRPFNKRILSILVSLCSVSVLIWLYPILEADSAQKYMESIYVVIVLTGVLLSFVSIILAKTTMFSLIRSLDEFWNQSQLNFDHPSLKKPEPHDVKSILKNTNEFVEKWSRIGLFVFKYMLGPSGIGLKIVVSFYTYFSTDAGNDAFDLPFPMWYGFIGFAHSFT